jgi:hypothetical protein
MSISMAALVPTEAPPPTRSIMPGAYITSLEVDPVLSQGWLELRVA